MAAKHVSALVILGGLTLMAACSRSRKDGQIVRDVQSKLYADSNILWVMRDGCEQAAYATALRKMGVYDSAR